MFFEHLNSNATDYIDWLESLDDGNYDLIDVKNYAEVNNVKEREFEMTVEKLMEDLFTYDGIYEDSKREFRQAEEKLFLIDNAAKDTRIIIDDGETIVDEARGFFVDGQNNFQVSKYFLLLLLSSSSYFRMIAFRLYKL